MTEMLVKRIVECFGFYVDELAPSHIEAIEKSKELIREYLEEEGSE